MLSPSPKRARADDILFDQYLAPTKKRQLSLPMQVRQNTTMSLFTESGGLVLQEHSPDLTPTESSDDDDGVDGKYPWSLSAIQQRPSENFSHSSAMSLDAVGSGLLPLSGGNLSLWPSSTYDNASVQPSPIPGGLVNQSLYITALTIGNSATDTRSTSAVQPLSAQHIGPSNSLNSEGPDDVSWNHQRLPNPAREARCNLESHSSVPSKVLCSEAASDSYNARISTPCDLSYAPNQTDHPSSSTPTQAVKKVRFSMGYRAGCDKCRLKVPGHYNHIVQA